MSEVAVAARRKIADRTRRKDDAVLKRGSQWRTGRYTPAEDAVILRLDITRREMSAILQRRTSSIANRLWCLRNLPRRDWSLSETRQEVFREEKYDRFTLTISGVYSGGVRSVMLQSRSLEDLMSSIGDPDKMQNLIATVRERKV